MKEARRLLGVSPGASKREIRRAFRRLAARLHPDVNNDPGAPKAFAAAVDAYRRLLAGETTRPAKARRKAVPAPYVCPACHDGYTQGGECPRCEVEVHRRAAGPVPPPPADAGVDAMIESLEAPGKEPWIRVHPAARVPMMAVGLVLCGLTQARIGLWILALMSFAFACAAMLAEAHGRSSKASWARVLD